MILFLGPALGGDTLVRVLIERRGFPGIAGHHPVGRRPRFWGLGRRQTVFLLAHTETWEHLGSFGLSPRPFPLLYGKSLENFLRWLWISSKQGS